MTFVTVTYYICHLDLSWVWLYNGVITKTKNKGDKNHENQSAGS